MKVNATNRLLLAGAAWLGCAAYGIAAPAGHAPTEAPCGEIWYSVDYEPDSLESLKDLPPEARGKLNAYLGERLGSEYASKLVLEGGQVVDRAELLAKAPESAGFTWKPPKYNIFLGFPVRGVPHGFCASIQLDDDGTVMSPIGLPQLREHPERGKLVSAREAARAAEQNGVPVDKATRELYYFADSDTIEYDFTYVDHEDDKLVHYKHLHVAAHDVTQVHWSTSTEPR